MFKNHDTIICPYNIKKEILKQISEENKLINLKILTLEEFKNIYFGSYNEKAIYYLMEKYNYKYDVAKTYLDNFYFNEKLKKELENNKLIYKQKININKIIIIGYSQIDNYIMDEIKKHDYEIIKDKENNYINKVYEFDTIEEEVDFTTNSIITLLNVVDISNICLVNVGSEYVKVLKRMFKFYNIPINLEEQKSIYKTNIGLKFLKTLKEKNKIEIDNNEIGKSILNIVNKYAFTSIDNISIKCIENELKNTYLKSSNLVRAINIVDINEIEDSKYYFVLGFNEGEIPKIYKDDDYYSDSLKEKLKMFTSVEKNVINRKETINKLNRKNVTISYKLNDNKTKYYPSSLIEEMNLEIIKEKSNYYNSDIYNKINLSRKLDKLIKYNEIDKDLDLLYSNYQDIKYLNYDNKFTGINKENYYKYINNELLLSYSSIDNYNRCGFKYYIKNLLKLDPFNDTFMTYIGNLFHYILSVCNEKEFDFEKEFNKFIANKEFNKKDEFFISKLKKDLLFTIEIIKKHNTYSELLNELNEKKIYINKDKNIKVTFMGIVDKIKYKCENNKTYIAIIDYKTGTVETNIDNTIYGIGMQLPIYLYLIKNSKLNNIEFIGFYKQRVIHNKLFNIENDYNEELEKQYRLEGYTINDESLVRMFDNTYIDSKMIKGMRVSSKGFYHYTKTLNKEDINNIEDIVEQKINEARDNILEAKFDINPKQIGMKLVGCEYCKFNDLCFKKEEDIIKLSETKFN